MDPVQAVNLMISGVKAAGAVGKFMEQRERRKTVEARQSLAAASKSAAAAAALTPEQRAANSDAFRRDVCVVLGVLGEKLLNLGTVNEAWLPYAREEVRKVLRIKGEGFLAIFEEDMEEAMQYTVTVAMFLCAGCWPMPIYRGFGACVMNEWLWASPDPGYPRPNDPETTQMDDCIALLKTAAQGHDVLTRYPLGLNQMSGDYNKHDGYLESIWYLDHKNSQLKKRGLPQPRDRSFGVTEMIWPWSTYDSQFALQNRFTHDFGEIGPMLRWQQDPGRMIYGFTVGGFLELQPGQMIETTSDIAVSILWWLWGTKGAIFKIIRQSELDIGHWKMRAKYQKQWDEAMHKTIYVVRDENLAQQRNAARMSVVPAMVTAPVPFASPAPSFSPSAVAGWPPVSPTGQQTTPIETPTAAVASTPFTPVSPEVPSPLPVTVSSQPQVQSQPVAQTTYFPPAPSQGIHMMPAYTVQPQAAPTGIALPPTPAPTLSISPYQGYPGAASPSSFITSPLPLTHTNSLSRGSVESAPVFQEPTLLPRAATMPIATNPYQPMPTPQPIHSTATVPLASPVPISTHQAPTAILASSQAAMSPPPSAPPTLYDSMSPQQPVYSPPISDTASLPNMFNSMVISSPSSTQPQYHQPTNLPAQTQYHQPANPPPQPQYHQPANPPSQFSHGLGALFAPSATPFSQPPPRSSLPPTQQTYPQQTYPQQAYPQQAYTQQAYTQPAPLSVATQPAHPQQWSDTSATTIPIEWHEPIPHGDPPPSYALRKVEAQFDFSARSGREISFRRGDVLEILRDSNGDGWLLARKGGEEGRVPEAYVTSF